MRQVWDAFAVDWLQISFISVTNTTQQLLSIQECLLAIAAKLRVLDKNIEQFLFVLQQQRLPDYVPVVIIKKDHKIAIPSAKTLAQNIESLNYGQHNVYDLLQPKLEMPAQPETAFLLMVKQDKERRIVNYKVLYKYARVNA
ncbi:hypothetical protein MP228_012567 [Amoeboaphelidium protococcarum]|nr:hypothetical protein MP228_012567 [Amoeboaphelidium protococcarum]